MEVRICVEPQLGASYEQILAVARTAEESGFDGFFRSDHYLRMGSATGLPAYTDAWTTLAGLARDTHSIRLGSLVTPVTFRAVGTFPAIVAEVDHMSHGRLDVGLGAGWYKEEHEAYGLAFPPIGVRYDLLEDQLAILHGIWSTPPGGTFQRAGLTCNVRLEADPLRAAQRPHPPIILGGAGGPRTRGLPLRSLTNFNVTNLPAQAMKTVHDSVRQSCEKLSRDPADLVWSITQVLCCGRSETEVARRAIALGTVAAELHQTVLSGSPAEILHKIGVFAEAGADRLYLRVRQSFRPRPFATGSRGGPATHTVWSALSPLILGPVAIVEAVGTEGGGTEPTRASKRPIRRSKLH